MKRFVELLFFNVAMTSVMTYGELGWQFRDFFVVYFPWLPELMLLFICLVAGWFSDKLLHFLISVVVSSITSVVVSISLVTMMVENPVYSHLLGYGVIKGSVALAFTYLVICSVIGSISVLVMGKNDRTF
ncbi:MAG: hypothetical protein PWP37_1413 [Thermotogota bacterium]|nr:hypothetical protein [Thermotogota bacterium]HCZ07082.1 hypothetical protein [Thermotogota bacterium]